MRKPSTPFLAVLAALGFLIIVGLQVWFFRQNPVSEGLPEIRIHKGQTTVKWSWNSGANKPLIEWGQESIIEVSGWASDVQVDDQSPVVLWDHYMGANATNNSLYASYNRPDDYLLEQKVTLESENRVRLQVFVTPYRFLGTLRLRLRHYKWWWREASVEERVFFATDKDSWTRVTLGGNFETLTPNRENQGVNFFDAYYSVSNVQGYTLVVDEVIEFGEP